MLCVCLGLTLLPLGACRPGKKGTLEGWLTTGTPAVAAKSPSKAGRPMPPLLLPQATGTFELPGGDGNGPARKKRK